MADRLRNQLSARSALAFRLGFVVGSLVTLYLGYRGLHTYIRTRPELRNTSTSPPDLVYYDVQLFLLQTPPIANGGPYPWELAVAKFTAPCVSAYGIIELATVLSAGRWRRARIRRHRGHVVVCGSTRIAAVLAERLRAARLTVVTVEGPGGENGGGGADTVAGDATDLRSLRAAGVERAAVVYSCLTDSHRNVQVADGVERLQADRRAAGAGRRGLPRPVPRRRDAGLPDPGVDAPVRVHALVGDLELCLALKARRWSSTGDESPRVDFFNADELAAQQVVRVDEELFGTAAPRVAVVGTGAFARSALVELARQWLVRRADDAGPVSAVLVGPDAEHAAAVTALRYPFVAAVCALTAFSGTVDEMFEARVRAGLPRLHRLYLCQEDEGEALRSALDSVARLATQLDAVVVRLDRLSGMARTFDRVPGDALLDALDGRLRVVDVAATACDPAAIGFDLAEVLARTAHQRYLMERLQEGLRPGATAALVGWDALPEEFRDASRAQTRHIGRKIAAIGALLVPRPTTGHPFAYREGEIDFLARQEHDRWWAERIGRGWRYGPVRDDRARQHPDMVPWKELTEDKQERDREVVRAIPQMLAEVGLAIVRVGPAPGRGDVLIGVPDF